MKIRCEGCDKIMVKDGFKKRDNKILEAYRCPECGQSVLIEKFIWNEGDRDYDYIRHA